MKLSILILLIFMGCKNTPEVPQEQRNTTVSTPVIVKICKDLPTPRYSKKFSELVCTLKESKQNIPLKAIILAQFIKETGRGHSRLATHFNNFGGLKWRKEMKAYGKPISYEAWDGRTDYIEFESVEKFIEGYWHFIGRYPYRGWDKYKNNPHGYIEFINRAGYTPPTSYYKDVIKLEKEAKRLLK